MQHLRGAFISSTFLLVLHFIPQPISSLEHVNHTHLLVVTELFSVHPNAKLYQAYKTTALIWISFNQNITSEIPSAQARCPLQAVNKSFIHTSSMLFPLQINFGFDLPSTESKLKYILQHNDPHNSGYHPILFPARLRDSAYSLLCEKLSLQPVLKRQITGVSIHACHQHQTVNW